VRSRFFVPAVGHLALVHQQEHEHCDLMHCSILFHRRENIQTVLHLSEVQSFRIRLPTASVEHNSDTTAFYV